MPELKERHLPEDCRQSITELLKETYGYDRFRNLEIYDDLFKSRETLCISQGQLIENVIREAEKARKEEVQPDNILLTAPTGSGKSLLFQLPAIYLGKEYNLLTIVVSPLKALIVDQVEGLQDLGYERVAYASSDLSPEQKMEVYRAVREGEIDLFYLSPELLLSYDIKHFVGNRRIGMVVIRVADHEGAVCVGVVDVVGAWLSRPRVGMILRAVPVDAIYSHGCHVGREDLKFPIFVARPKEVVAAVAPPQSVGHRVLRASIPAGVVPALVLEHHGGDLPLWVRHPVASIAHLHLHLLVVLVDGCVRIGQHL